jgi:hypothetical protein
MTILDKIKYTNKYIKFIHLIHFLNILPKRKLEEKEFDIHQIVKKYDNIKVLASGPSANQCKLSKNSLYITTNSSYLKLDKSSAFIHIIKDLGYLHKFFMFGLKFKPKILILDVNTHSNGQGMGATSIKLINRFLERRKYDYPVAVTDNENILKVNKKSYRKDLSDFMAKHKISRKGSNSGELIYAYGVWLTVVNQIETLEVYGIDAGEGGQVHFDGRTTAKNHVAFRDKNKKSMGDFFEQCQSKFDHIKNYSYFKNNTNETT